MLFPAVSAPGAAPAGSRDAGVTAGADGGLGGRAGVAELGQALAEGGCITFGEAVTNKTEINNSFLMLKWTKGVFLWVRAQRSCE